MLWLVGIIRSILREFDFGVSAELSNRKRAKMGSNNLLAIIIKKRKTGHIRTPLKCLDFSQNPLIPEFYPNFPENHESP